VDWEELDAERLTLFPCTGRRDLFLIHFSFGACYGSSTKLNQAYFNGALLIAAGLGIVTSLGWCYRWRRLQPRR